MSLLNLVVGIVAIEHMIFLILESFLWTHSIGRKVFQQSMEDAKKSKALAANQGLYNGFLSAGLVWSLLSTNLDFAIQLKIFFLSCVAIAGIVGALTVNFRIFLVQAVPAIIGLLILGFH